MRGKSLFVILALFMLACSTDSATETTNNDQQNNDQGNGDGNDQGNDPESRRVGQIIFETNLSGAVNTFTYTYNYNADNNLESISSTGIERFEYTYSDGRVISYRELNTNTNTVVSSNDYNYDINGRLASIDYRRWPTDPSTIITINYDNSGRPTDFFYYRSETHLQNGDYFRQVSQIYQANSNNLLETEQRDGGICVNRVRNEFSGFENKFYVGEAIHNMLASSRLSPRTNIDLGNDTLFSRNFEMDCDTGTDVYQISSTTYTLDADGYVTIAVQSFFTQSGDPAGEQIRTYQYID